MRKQIILFGITILTIGVIVWYAVGNITYACSKLVLEIIGNSEGLAYNQIAWANAGGLAFFTLGLFIFGIILILYGIFKGWKHKPE